MRLVRYVLGLLSRAALPSPDRADRTFGTKSEGSHPEASEPLVIGQQLADAHAADTKWRESGGGGYSPLPETKYDFWRGDFSLITPAANPLDDEIRRVCHQYAQSDPDQRFTIRRSISMDQFYTLMDFARRCAVFAMRDATPELAADGLTAMAMIDQERVDFRDILTCLGLLYHAASKTGGNADAMFRVASALSEPAVATYFINFIQQSADYRDLRTSWGYDEVQTKGGIGFIGWGFSEYNPTIDLKSTIIEISQLVASDSYQPSQIEVATDLPDVWLGGRVNASLQRTLSSVRAVATISASLNPDKHPNHNSQQFTVFLVETANDSDAQELYQMAQDNKSPSHCKLALARSRWFCLVVARSFVQGVAAYETNDSLTRFGDGLGEILKRHARIEEVK